MVKIYTPRPPVGVDLVRLRLVRRLHPTHQRESLLRGIDAAYERYFQTCRRRPDKKNTGGLG